MKAFNKILCLASLAGLFLLPSCNKIEEPTNLPANQVRMTISTAAVGFDAETKTSIEGLTPSWSTGDKIGVITNDNSGNAEFTSTLSGDKKTATFTGSASLVTGDNTIYAYYPYSALNASNTKNAAIVALPKEQNPSMSSFDPLADIMVGKPYTYDYSGSGNASINDFQFHRMMAIVKLSFVKADGATFDLTSETVENVTMIAGSTRESGAEVTSPLTGKVSLDIENATLTMDANDRISSVPYF